MPSVGNGVVIVGAARTVIGSYGEALKAYLACDLAAIFAKEAFSCAWVDPELGEQIVIGHVLHPEARDMYIARGAGLPLNL